MPVRRARGQSIDDSEEGGFREDFNAAVYRAVRRIPEGKVASYGTIAKMIGHPRHSRMVGTALKCLPPSLASPYLAPAPRSSSGESSTSTTSNSTTMTNPLFNFDLDLQATAPSRSTVLSADVTTEALIESWTRSGEEGGGGDGDDDYVQPAPQANPEWVPWHRVVSSTGVISPRGNDRAVRRQADYLVAEGIEVKDGTRAGGGGSDGRQQGVDAFGLGGISGGRVSMTTYGWSG